MKHINSQSIRYQITKITVIYALALIILMTISYRTFYESFSQKKIIRAAEFNLQLITDTVSQNLNNIFSFSNWCASNNSVFNYLTTPSDVPKPLDSYERLKEEFYSTASSQYIERLVVSNYDTGFMQILTANWDDASIFDASIIYDSLQLKDKIPPKLPVLTGIFQDPLVPGHQIFSVVQNITLFNGTSIGWIYMAVPVSIINDSTANYETSTGNRLFFELNEQIYEIADHQILPVDREWRSIREYNNIAYNSRTRTEKVYLDSTNSSSILITYPSSIEGLTFLQLISKSDIDSSEHFYYFTLFLSLLMVMFLTAIIVLYLNYHIGKPIYNIHEKIHAISQGDFTYSPEIEGGNELGQVGHGINIMAQDIKELIERKIVMEKQKQDLEIQILHDQINPHFLYNTLNSIRLMAILQNATGIPEMTTSLSHLLKNITKNTKYLIPLKDELDLLNDYFLIEKYRYSGSIKLLVHIDNPELYECMVPKMMLQPLVENAIFHGIESKGQQGIISIDIRNINNSSFVIIITDNGIGISKELAEQLLYGDNEAGDIKKIGISNVNMRIKYHFGEEYGLQIKSELNQYTQISIALPCTKERNDFTS